jgi:transposase InsO family protein
VKKSLAAARRAASPIVQPWRPLLVELLGEGREQMPPLSMARRCQSLAVSRAASSRWHTAGLAIAPEMEAREQIQRIALEMPADGSRRITHERQRRGLVINHTRVLRLMREDHLRCRRTRSVVRTTNAQQQLSLYPHWLPEWVVDGLEQRWVADLTYVRWPHACVSLAGLLDAYSRRGLGWALDHALAAELAVVALPMALATRRIRPELVHHAERGVQYAAQISMNVLKERHIRISMSRTGNPDDKAQAESFIKTLNYEEVYLFE